VESITRRSNVFDEAQGKVIIAQNEPGVECKGMRVKSGANFQKGFTA
jgi:hypothetical protein